MSPRHMLVITIWRGSHLSRVFWVFFLTSYASGGFKCSPDSPSLCIPLSFWFQATQVHVEQHPGEKLRTLTEEPTPRCPQHKLENTLWSKQHHKEGGPGFIPPSPYSSGAHKRINCGGWGCLARSPESSGQPATLMLAVCCVQPRPPAAAGIERSLSSWWSR